MKKTPGPWKIVKRPTSNFTYHYIEAGKGFLDENAVAEGGFSISGIMIPEDAQLIASSPDLLEALKMLLACSIVAKFPEDVETFLNAKLYAEKAISKAEGRL